MLAVARVKNAGELEDHGLRQPGTERVIDALAERHARFLRYWTCKEAMSKATGDGLSAPMRRLEVRLTDGIELAGGPAPYEPARWRLHAIDVPDGYLATLALWSDERQVPKLGEP